jgi:hypothetical protein
VKRLENILNIVGVLTFFVLFLHLINNFLRRTETNLVSKEGMKVLNDPEKKEKLRVVIDDYHNTGIWDNEKLESIL